MDLRETRRLCNRLDGLRHEPTRIKWALPLTGKYPVIWPCIGVMVLLVSFQLGDLRLIEYDSSFTRLSLRFADLTLKQTFPYALERNRRPIRCGAVRVAFIARKRLGDVPVQPF